MFGRELDLIFDRLEATTGPFARRGRELLRVVLETPTIETWDDVHSFVLIRRPTIRFLDAVQAVDPDFPVPPRTLQVDGVWLRNWYRPPTRHILLEALRYAAYGRRSLPPARKSDGLEGEL
jgi:hypothetical protein